MTEVVVRLRRIVGSGIDGHASDPDQRSLRVATRKPKRDEEREDRITMEVVVDAYDEVERATSWYYYLEDRLRFPFNAGCTAKRATSPLRLKNNVAVVGMPDEDECMRAMFVTIRKGKDHLAVPLAQLKPARDTDERTKEAIEDWHYWVRMGYEF